MLHVEVHLIENNKPERSFMGGVQQGLQRISVVDEELR